MSRQQFFVFVIAGMSLLFLLYIFLKPHAKTSNTPLEKITIGRVKGYPDLALIAQNKNYFKTNGLAVTFKEYDRPSPLMKDVLSARTNLVSATAEFLVVSNSFKNKNLKIITAVSSQDNQWEIIARKDKNIHHIEDLKGKKIGVQSQTVGGFLLGRFLTYYGMKPTDVEIDNLSRQEYENQLVHGDIDAVEATGPYTKEIKALLGNNAISWSAQPERTVYSVSYTTNDFIKKHPKMIERYLRALIQAQEFVKSHNVEAQSIMGQQLSLSNADMKDLWPKYTFGIELPQELLITMEDEARWVIENNFTIATKIPNYLDTIYFKGLETVKTEAITMYH